MELTFDRLIKFDLMRELDNECATNPELFFRYFALREEIRGVDQFIKDSPSFPGSTDKIIRSELMAAIGATLAIEGTLMSEDEIKRSFQKADIKETLARKEQEAENSRKVYYFIIDLISRGGETFSYNESIIWQIHKYFTEDINYLSNVPGQYRGDFPVTFGDPRRRSICRNRSEVEIAMHNYVDWLNNNSNSFIANDPLPKAIMAHYYLTEIHPFTDGNGRTARAVEALVLFNYGINRYCFWSLANFWSVHKNEYISHLGKIRDTCDPWEFIIWGMSGYLEELKRIKEKVLKKVKQLMLLDYVRYLHQNKKHQETKINSRVVEVMRILINEAPFEMSSFLASPYIQAMYSNVSKATLYRDFEKMVKLGLIKLTGNGKKKTIEANFQLLEALRYKA